LGTNYHLEELIKGASDRLILISPFLKLNDRMKELLADKNRLKIDVRIVWDPLDFSAKSDGSDRQQRRGSGFISC
jgi:hypothetical protein